MDILLLVSAVLCALLGLAGAVVPVLPGPPLGFLALMLCRWSGYGDFSGRFLLFWGIVAAAVTVADYYLPGWMTRRMGGSRAATVGATIGVFAGLFLFPPVGIILCPFFGALVGELIHDRRDHTRALRAAMGSFLAFLLGTGLKLIVGGAMLYFVVRALFA